MSATEKRCFTVLFDVFQTVVSLDRLRLAMMSRGLPSHALMLFFDRMLHDAFALNISGVPYKPFLEVASAALVVTFRIQGQSLSQDEAKALLKEECSQLDAMDDVLPAVRMLAAAGIDMYALSNGSRENTEKLLKRNNLDTFFKGVISIDDVQAWKPDRRVYEHAARTVGKSPQDCVLFSCHAWDVCGAQQAGMVGAYVTRLEMVYSPALPPPSLSGENLFEVARELILRSRAHHA